MEKEIMDGKTITEKAMNLIDERHKTKETCTGITSGFLYLDQMTLGFQNSDLIIIGSKPDVGKTALALSMIHNIAIGNKIPCGLLSLEESCATIGVQLLSQIAEVNLQKINHGLLNEDELRKINDSAEKLSDSPVYISDIPGLNFSKLSELAKCMVKENNTKILFIDYLNLIETENSGCSCYDARSKIAVSLKNLAKELCFPIVVLCQISRDSKKINPNIEQTSDILLYLQRNEGKKFASSPEAKIIVAKNNHGSLGKFFVNFNQECYRFTDEKY
ncbi:MAG: DnaB-like helicase C-terminal domain-containing protein [Treponema sp.]|nr:DnaB-like helicase C-terminal domain-containing protein [Treponema sp.]